MTRLIDRLKNTIKLARRPDEVKSFHADQVREEAFESIDRGVRTVPLDQIVGSVGRYHDFDKSFRPKEPLCLDRMKGIRQAMENAKTLPPVNLYQIKDKYYVVDGNHRVSAAKELGYRQIDARILEFLSSRRTLENILYYEKNEFEELTGLKDKIELSEIGQYSHLLEQIENHRDFLAQSREEEVSAPEAAAEWYATIYTPLSIIIRNSRLLDHFPGRTLADLYTYISIHQWDKPHLTRDYGIGINILVPEDMEEFRSMMSKMKESDYPEMVREITAFILMNVSGKKEDRLVDKLFELDEITEVHSVHGSVDIIAKMVLKRTLLLSDAETIGAFVRDKIRSIDGIVSTQTLIPSQSKTKEPERG